MEKSALSFGRTLAARARRNTLIPGGEGNGNMPDVIAEVPKSFNLTPFGCGWYHWEDIEECFRPGPGGRSVKVNPELAPVRVQGGVYVLAWSKNAPRKIHPADESVLYCGETDNFKRRLTDFGRSAAFWNEKRKRGHSAAWRWPKGRNQHLWVAFFLVGNDLRAHLARGLRKWMEAVAQEEHRLVHERLPALNEANGEISLPDLRG
jgi:hypothetical protein